MSAYSNVNLDSLKAFLGYTTGGSPSPVGDRDATLTLYLNAGLALLKKLTGRNLERALYRDTFGYQPQRAHLREWPVELVQAVQIGGVDVAATDYQVFYGTGLVYFKNLCYQRQYLDFQQSFLTIDYVAGYAELPDDLVIALYTAIQSVDVAQKQLSTSGGILKRVSVYDVGVTDYYIPEGGSISTQMNKVMAPIVEVWAGALPGDLGAPLLHEVEVIGEAP